MHNILPWQMNTWQQLAAYKHNQQIPSGMLLTGPPGIGKTIFATHYAQFILCQGANEHKCGECRSCILFSAGNHPDFFFIQAEEKNATIKVDQVRDLIENLNQTSVMNDFQVALISFAEDMNKAAANALLKTLEEPRGRVLILLLSQQPSSIPATVRSRCQHIKLPLPTKEQAKRWLLSQLNSDERATSYLSIADYLPLKALEHANEEAQQIRDALIMSMQQIQKGVVDPIQVAADCLTLPFEKLQFLATITLDMIRMKFSSKAFLNHHDKISLLAELCRDITVRKLFQFLDDILAGTKLLTNRSNVNLQLLMEKIFINWRYIHDLS